jgi:hypothetical protein
MNNSIFAGEKTQKGAKPDIEVKSRGGTAQAWAPPISRQKAPHIKNQPGSVQYKTRLISI